MKVVKTETKEKQITVLELLEQDGYKWKDGQAPTDYIPYERSRELGLKKIITASNRPYPGDDEISYQQFISRNRKVIL